MKFLSFTWLVHVFYVCAVPRRETNRLQQNERFPVLGGYYWREKQTCQKSKGALWMFFTFLYLRHCRQTFPGHASCQTAVHWSGIPVSALWDEVVKRWLSRACVQSQTCCSISSEYCFPLMVTVVLLLSLSMSCDYLGCPIQCTYLTWHKMHEALCLQAVHFSYLLGD